MGWRWTDKEKLQSINTLELLYTHKICYKVIFQRTQGWSYQNNE